MAWIRSILHGSWTAREINRLYNARGRANPVQRRQSRAQLERQRNLERRIEELEEDLRESIPRVRTLAELCLSKGSITDEGFAVRAEYVEGLDGQLDSRASRPRGDGPAEPSNDA